MKKQLLITILTLLSVLSFAQEPLIINSHNRQVTSLNGAWKIIVDPYETGYYSYRYEAFDQMENPWSSAYFMDAKAQDKTDLLEYDFDKSETLQVPGDWNMQDEQFYLYEGTIWYRKKFDYNKSDDERLFVYFGAANYEAHVYLNGKKLGTHVGGFTPFNFEITGLVENENSLVVKVDNTRKMEAVPTVNTDWWNFGGLTRDVKLISVPNTFIRDYFIQLEKGSSNTLAGYVQLDGRDAEQDVMLEIPELGLKESFGSDANGRADIELEVNDLERWSPDHPKLYDVHLSVNGHSLTDQIGFRTIETRGKDILLNGESVFLRGISIHEENPHEEGRAATEEDARRLLGWAKELNCNFVRLAHYPHNEFMVRMADEMGLMVWEEIPVYWTIQWENQQTYQNAENQLVETVNRDKNRASVVIYSIANETPPSEPRLEFLGNLAAKVRELDNTRLISAAMEVHGSDDDPFVRILDDELSQYTDILSFNEYVGWYDGLPDKCAKIKWVIDEDKPVFVSEFGAGAKQGFHADKLTRWSEEYQEYLYEENLKMIDRIDGLRGCTPWILLDFHSPRRMLPEIQDGYNRKGLISEDGKKKKAFYILQEFYQEKEAAYK